MRFLGYILVGVVLSLAPAAAQTGRWDESFDFSRVRLISAKEMLDGQALVQLGLEFDVADGWNIYWRSPGPVGLPPVVTWQDQSNIQESQIQWPVPERYTYTFPGDELGIESMVYRGNTILPIDLTIVDPNQPLFLRALVEYMVCQEQCIFGEATVALDLFVGGEETVLSEHAPRINEFASRVPFAYSPNASLGLSEHRFDPNSQELIFGLHSPIPMTAPDIFVETPEVEPGFVFGRSVVDLSAGALSATVRIPVQEIAYSGVGPMDTDLRLTLVDGERGVDLGFVRLGSPQGLSQAEWARGPVPHASTDTPSQANSWPLLALVVAALAAGFILNLMPCVLPVLSLKLMAFVGRPDQSRANIRRRFLATAAGVLVSFWLLASLIVVLQYLGNSVGWGFQFQSPWFVSAMIALMVVFAANLFGWFDLPVIPGINVIGVGRASLAGDFLTGVLATLLATPCSAPLLAPVIGVAFAGDTTTIFALFTLIAIGMASPYWLVVLLPSLAQFMPKPGQWMMMLKIILGLSLLAFAMFLGWVLLTQRGIWVASSAVGLAVLVLLFLYSRRKVLGRGLGPILGFFLLALVPGAFAGLAPSGREVGWQSPSREGAINWISFNDAELARMVAEGKTVFVDVTATWCVNCQFNKAIAIEVDQVRQAFQEENVVAMVADWTNHDPEIGAYLSRFGRAGIPFNIVYSPTHPNGKVLPTLLTKNIVLDALDR